MSILHTIAVLANMAEEEKEDEECVSPRPASNGSSPETRSGSSFAAFAICGLIVFLLLLSVLCFCFL